MNSPTRGRAPRPPGRLVLELRHPARLAEAGQALQHPGELGVLGHVATARRSSSAPGRAHRRAAGRPRPRVRSRSCRRVLLDGDRVQVGDEVERLVVVLQRHPLPQRAEVVAEVERVGGRLDAGEHPGTRWVGAWPRFVSTAIAATRGRHRAARGDRPRDARAPAGSEPGRPGDPATRRSAVTVSDRRRQVHIDAVTASPASGSRPSPAIRKPADRLVRALGSTTPVRSAKSSRLSRPSTSTSPTSAGARAPGYVVLVVDLADELLDQVLQGDDAGRAAVLVDDDRQVVALAAHLGQRRQHALARRQPLHRRGPARPRCGSPVAVGLGAAGRAGARSRSRRRASRRSPGSGEWRAARTSRARPRRRSGRRRGTPPRCGGTITSRTCRVPVADLVDDAALLAVERALAATRSAARPRIRCGRRRSRRAAGQPADGRVGARTRSGPGACHRARGGCRGRLRAGGSARTSHGASRAPRYVPTAYRCRRFVEQGSG